MFDKFFEPFGSLGIEMIIGDRIYLDISLMVFEDWVETHLMLDH